MVILMKIKNIINNYVECNLFEIKIIDDRVKIYYYDKIKHFSNNKIIVSKDNKNYKIEGKNLIVEKLFKELLVIKGDVNKILLGDFNE